MEPGSLWGSDSPMFVMNRVPSGMALGTRDCCARVGSWQNSRRASGQSIAGEPIAVARRAGVVRAGAVLGLIG
jgi:hypothetical protein